MNMLTKMVVVGAVFAQCAICHGSQYLVIDVSGGTNADEFPVSYLDKAPEAGWGDEYKTDKIVLSKVSSDGSSFYIGVYEITQRQWELVTGKKPSYYNSEDCYATRPVESVSYDDIRGKEKGSEYPKSMDVDEGSFIAVLRAKTKLLKLDLPTQEQWMIACNDRDVEDPSVISGMARFGVNRGYYLEPAVASAGCDTNNGTAKVGSYKPNGRGLYDMYGNVCEWCLDSCDLSDAEVIRLGCTWEEFRPFGVVRVLKGGNCEVGHCGFHIGYGHYVDGRCQDPYCKKRMELLQRYCSSKAVYGATSSCLVSVAGLRIAVTR